MLTVLTDADFETALTAADAGVLLFFKKLCPHCKNMEKVLEKFAMLQPTVGLFGIDVEENPSAAATYNAERAPTLVILKKGVSVGQKTGLMNPKELVAFYASC